MSPASLVTVRDLHRSYADLHALRGLSFELQRGEVLGFLGPNGAGKSTTMQIMAGTLAPSAGSVRIDGHDVLEDARAAKSRIGYLPETPPLYRELKVDEYLRFCARLHGLRGTRGRDACTRAKRRCGLAEVGHRLIGNLSKGYQQRVGIAQAILHSPPLVILDEPTVGLDPIQIREIRALILELGGEHSVILSTHVLPEVQAVCDRVLILHRGRLLLDARMAELDGACDEAVLSVALSHPPPPAELAALDEVRSLEALDGGRFRLHHTGEDGFAERFAAAAVARGWGLAELLTQRRTLEDLFVTLTCGEDEPVGARTRGGQP